MTKSRCFYQAKINHTNTAASADSFKITKEGLEEAVGRAVRAVPVIVVDGLEKTFDQLRTLL